MDKKLVQGKVKTWSYSCAQETRQSAKPAQHVLRCPWRCLNMRNRLSTLPLAKPNAEATLKTYKQFIYGHTRYLTNSFRTNVLKITTPQLCCGLHFFKINFSYYRHTLFHTIFRKYVGKIVRIIIFILIYSSFCGPGSVVGIATAYGLDGPGIESQWGEIFRASPDRPWGPPSLLYNGYRVFPRGKVLPGRDADPSPPSSVDV